MSLLTPIGLLGLIGLVVLIIIYIIKPNYQSKFISSTYIWKLSLKYRKKKIPISKLRNILLFICQIIILTAAAFVLTQPFIDDGAENKDGEVILIVDASASMQSVADDKTRIERAIDAAYADAQLALENGYNVSLILAGQKSTFLIQQTNDAETVNTAFETLRANAKSSIVNTTPDIEGAMKLAEQITADTPNTAVTLYTDTEYLNEGKVKVHNVKEPSEYNVAILDVRATMVENYYRIEIDVACYGADTRVTLACDIDDVNETGSTMQLEADVYCSDDKIQTVIFAFVTEDMLDIEKDLVAESIEVYAYDSIHVSVNEKDAIASDNSFYLYGGKKPTLKVQYYSNNPNPFFTSALLVIKDMISDDWALELTEVGKDQNPAIEGFDLYIFEHVAPATVPTDGVVIYMDVQNIPPATGITYDGKQGNKEVSFPLYAGEDTHKIMENIDPSKITVSEFLGIRNADGYLNLMKFDIYPFLLMKEEIDQKIIVMPFSLHYSNLALTKEFPLLLKNTIEYFFPVAIDEYVYETGDKLTVDIKTNLLEVTGPNFSKDFTEFPAEWTVENPGTYTLMRDSLSGLPIVENIFVKLPAEENNTSLTVDILENPYFYTQEDSNDLDLLFYFALAIVAFLFIEWWLKSREQI